MAPFSSRSLAGLTFLCAAVLALCTSGCNTSSGWTRNQVGKRYYSTGDYTAARRSFEQAMMNDPWNPDYAFNVAAAMQKQGDQLAAERMYEHTLTLNPSHQPAYHGLAGLLHDQGRSDEAQELLTAWVETQPYTPESHIEMAWMQQETGNMSGAEASLQQALRQNPRHPRAMAQLGQVYERSGRSAEAASLYQRSLAYNRMQPQVAGRLHTMQTAGPTSPALMLAEQLPQSGSQYAMHPQFVSGTAAAPVAYTTMLPASPTMQPMPAPGMTGAQTVAWVPMNAAPTTAAAAGPVWYTNGVGGAALPVVAQQSTTVSLPGGGFAQPMLMGFAAPQPAGGGQPTAYPTSAAPVAAPFSMAAPTAVPTPSVAPQPVQLGVPAPISQNPAAAYPAITAVVPVVSAF